MIRNRKGFTLIELLIVVVIIGILAAIAIPKFSGTKSKAYIAAMKSDLKNLVTAEESYYADNDTYGTVAQVVAANLWTASGTVAVADVSANATGFSFTATHPSVAGVTCAVFVGDAAAVAPAVDAGSPACN